MEIVAIMTAIKVAYQVLAARVLAFVALLMTFGLFAWAMYVGTWLHFTIAGAFGLLIFLPVLYSAGFRSNAGVSDNGQD